MKKNNYLLCITYNQSTTCIVIQNGSLFDEAKNCDKIALI